MAKPRRQVYTMDMYLNKLRDGDIANNADVQRNFVWNNEQINELIVTVLNDEYIPPVILGEEDSSQLRIVDGGQRSFALNQYRFGNYRITSAVEHSRISYKAKTVDENGNFIWKDAVFDIKNKTYEKLPEELKKKFCEYQIETVIHEHCDRKRISAYIKRYNNHTSMNTNQKAFTYIDCFAADIRSISDSRFFVDYSCFTEAERAKGAIERVIIETVMCTGHLDHWKKQLKAICVYLNQNARRQEFETLAKHLHRLEMVITDDIIDLFDSRESFLFLTLYDRFTALGAKDARFALFLREFKFRLRAQEKKNGLLFDEIDKGRGTKDKYVICAKLKFLESVLADFLGRQKPMNLAADEEQFVTELVGIGTKTFRENREVYEETLKLLEERTIKIGSDLLDGENHMSLLAMVAYSYLTDKDLDDWMAVFSKKNQSYDKDQKKNFRYMLQDFERFQAKKKADRL